MMNQDEGAVVRQSTLYCQRADWGDLVHFMADPNVTRLYDSTREVLRATVRERADDGAKGYWGWWDNEKAIFAHVYAERGLVEMCFPLRHADRAGARSRPAVAGRGDPRGERG